MLDECFLCHKEVDNEGGTVEDAGIKLQIPKDAIPPRETCAITVYASVCGPSVQSNIHLVTLVFHIKCVPERRFNKEIELTIEHFTTLETQDDVDDLVYMVSSKGEDFSPSGPVSAEVGSSYGTVHVTHFCKFAFGIFHRGRCSYSHAYTWYNNNITCIYSYNSYPLLPPCSTEVEVLYVSSFT